MKDIKEISLTNSFTKELLILSSDLSLIINYDMSIEEIICEDTQLCQAMKTPDETIYSPKDFYFYLDSLIRTGETLQGNFIIKAGESHLPVLFKGKKAGGRLLLTGRFQKSIFTNGSHFLHKLPIPAMAVDESGRIVETNHAMKHLHKYLFKETRIYSELFSADHLPPLYNVYRDIVKTAKNGMGEAVKDFRHKDTRLIVKGVREDTLTIILVKDESIRERLRHLLSYQQQMQAVSQISAGVAHELRNPLSVIKGFIQLSKLSGDLDKYYETISSEMDRMNKIIEDFLSVSRRKVDKKYMYPADLVDSMLLIFQSECTLHNVTFKYRITDCSSLLYINEQMLKQVLINILRNAIEAYTDQKNDRVFYLTAYPHETFFVLNLTDHGPGMSAEVISRITEPFFTTKNNGTGIGLPLGKQIIEDHKGKFEIISKEGKGTTVSVRLPLFSGKSE